MFLNTYQRSRTTSSRRIVKTQKEIYEEGMKKQFPDRPSYKSVKTVKPFKDKKLTTSVKDYL